MKKLLTTILFVLAAMVCISACGMSDRHTRHDMSAGMPLPFCDDGSFIITRQFYDELGELSSFGSFAFGVGWRTESITSTVVWHSQYVAVDFELHAAEFIDLMNSLTPVFVDAISICTVNTNNWLDNPFRLPSRAEHLYFWAHNNIGITMPGIRMSVYQGGGNGYLFISLFFWDADRRVRQDDLIHHSLYRINSDDLARFSAFAEGLTRGVQTSHGHRSFSRLQVWVVTAAIIIGFILVIRGSILIYKSRRRKPPTDGSETHNVQALREELQGGIFLVPAMVMIPLLIFFFRPYSVSDWIVHFRVIDPIVWIVIAFFTIVAGFCLVVFACINKGRFRKK